MKNLAFILALLISVSTHAQDTVPPTPPEPRVQTPTAITPPPRPRPRPVNPVLDSIRRDSITRAMDSLTRVNDSLAADTMRSSIPSRDSIIIALKHTVGSDSAKYLDPFFIKYTYPVRYTVSRKIWEGKEEIFYSVIALLILFAVLRNSFRRYVADLFKVYFRTTVRQRQIRDQMLQSPLPSILFNAFFALSAGVYVALLFYHYQWAAHINLVVLSLYCAVAIAAIYAVKYFTLKLVGWIFQASDISGTYVFIVFTANKILGVVLLPFIVVLAFTFGNIYAAAITLSLVVVVALFIYRYFISYMSVSRSLRLNFFHFLLYLAAFELLPLLVINKVLVTYLDHLY